MSSNPKEKNPQDDDEIDLDSDSDNDENENENNENKNIEVSNNDNKGNEKQEEEINQKEDISPNEPAAAASTTSTTTTATATATTTKKATSKKSKLQERLRKLQLKINQSKKLNHQQVREEGERLCSKEAIRKHKNQTFKNDLKAKKQEEWDNVHEKNVSNLLKNNDDSKNSSGNGNGSASASASGSNSGKFVNKSKKEIKALTESGSESLRHAFKKTEKVERNRYSTTDCYNPEGQLRNYERSLESISGSSAGGSRSSGIRVAAPVADSYNHDTNTERQFMNERNGAKRLADELKRREKKSEKRKQKQMDFEAADVSYINKRNKHFNEKINRNYDKHTAEIRQNLERGTAL